MRLAFCTGYIRAALQAPFLARQASLVLSKIVGRVAAQAVVFCKTIAVLTR